MLKEEGIDQIEEDFTTVGRCWGGMLKKKRFIEFWRINGYSEGSPRVSSLSIPVQHPGSLALFQACSGRLYT